MSLALILLLSVPLAVDLAKVYPATLDYFEGQPTRAWTCTENDVWTLKSFRYELGGNLEIDLGPSNVVFGIHENNVVWAALIPHDPGAVVVNDLGTRVASIWLRFNPIHLGELFPPETVVGNGPAEMLVWAKRICAWKIRSGWQANDLPVIPRRNSLVFDIDTPDIQRVYCVVDVETQTVERIHAFNDRAMPKLVPMEPAQAVAAFDAVWDAYDREYAKFIIRPDIDWKRSAERRRPRAEQASTTYEAAAAIAALLSELRDLHIWVRVGQEFVPGYTRSRLLNASWHGSRHILGGWNETKHGLTWARTNDDIGYINIHALNDQALPETLDLVLQELASTWALIIDLRFNGGGDELLARALAGRFLDKPRIYSLNQYRNGPNHDDLGPKLERIVEPRGPWRYESPILVLWGQRTMSSAESFALMLAQCPQAIAMGDRTAGSSANPRVIELEGGISLSLPRWLDMDPQGNAIEDVGIEPQVKLDTKSSDFTPVSDPVLVHALRKLRETPQEQRAAGKREP